MSLIPTIFRSTDPGAPILTGQAGSFAALLDAVLVSGYGVGGEFKAPLGWVRAFTDGSKRAYRNSISDGGTGMYWRVDDSNAQYALCSAFHSMTTIDAGVDGFGGTLNAWGKSTTANTTARAWYVVGNGRTVYLFINNGNRSAFTGYVVGDYERINRNYEFNYCIANSGLATVTTGGARSCLLQGGTTAGNIVMARDVAGSVVGFSTVPRNALLSNAVNLGAGGYTYPFAGNAGVLMSRVMLNVSAVPFALYPGMWTTEHPSPFNRFEEVGSIVDVPGEFFAVESYGSVLGNGLLRLDAAWEY